MTDRKTQDTTKIPEWQVVESNDAIQYLRDRISELEWQLTLSELRNRNLQAIVEKQEHGTKE